ncbi:MULTISPECIES: tetratricopeptide repeat protein [Pirellulaceae]|uniref:tetratricopeptide repeat protein n=1 Tax=Pirellulaceae TaxID=2691357 RepID=UPI001304BF77|nr:MULTISPECIES: tetratricopeptide repeat protein [Pirellulaceae]
MGCEVQKNGRGGQRQNGVDVFVHTQQGSWIGIQCKGKDNYQDKKVTRAELRREVKAADNFRPKLSEYILATTARRDGGIQEFARILTVERGKKGLFPVRVRSWDDIRDLLDSHPEVVSEVYKGAPFVQDVPILVNHLVHLLGLDAPRGDANHQDLPNSKAIAIRDAISALGTKRHGDHDQLLEDIGPESTGKLMGGKQRRQKARRPRVTKRGVTPTILSPERTRLLALIATTPRPFSVEDLKRIFPHIDWKEDIRYFRRKQLLKTENGKLSVPKGIRQSIMPKKTDEDVYLKEWINVLEPLKAHPDTAIFLAMQQVKSGLVVEAVETLVEMAETLFPGPWNEICLSWLLEADRPEFTSRLSQEQRVHYLNAVALCYSRSRQFTKAVSWFVKMRRFSKRVGHNWGVGQSYHNCGIAYLEAGDLKNAATNFQKSIDHVRETGDKFLLGRSLYELAMTLSSSSYEKAEQLFSESEQVKRDNGDDDGLLGIYHGRATLAVQRGDFKDALDWFRKAEQSAQKVGHFHAVALETYNIGKTFADLGDLEQSLSYAQRAKELAEKDEFPDVLLLSVGGEALAYHHLGWHDKAEAAFRQLFELHSEEGKHREAVIALHDAGAALASQRKYNDARKTLAKASKLAAQFKIREWLYQSQADIALTHSMEGNDTKALSVLRSKAQHAESCGENWVATKLWIDVIELLLKCDASHTRIKSAVDRALGAAEVLDDKSSLQAKIYANWYWLCWQRQEYDDSLRALEDMLAAARRSKDNELIGRAEDQLGVCLQQLGRFDEAVSKHRRARSAAVRAGNQELVEAISSNLGSALRNVGRHAKAREAYDEAERIALGRGDIEAAIGIAHNRALSWQAQDELDQAENDFRECRDKARRRGFHGEYVRALHALANVSWQRGNVREAVKRYQRALDAAEKFLDSERHRICINYAVALRHKNEEEKAVAVLESASVDFQGLPDAHVYHSLLGDLYEDVGNLDLAAKQWKLAQLNAMRTRDESAIATSASLLAAFEGEAGRLEEADRNCQLALGHESIPELRLPLLVQRLGVVLELDDEALINEVLEEIQILAIETKTDDDLIDALTMLGEYNWEKKLEDDSIKSFILAMSRCPQTDFERFVEIGSIAASKLASLWNDGPERSSALLNSTMDWLVEEQGCKQTAILLWPFAVGERVAKDISTSDFQAVDELQISEKIFGIVMEEVLAVCGK